MKTRMGVVVVTYNRLELLKECVTQIEKQTVPFDKIVIVNNNSTDGTKEFLKQLTSDKFHIIEETVNGGGAKGFHDGLEYISKSSCCDWTVIIDDDAMLETDFLEKILEGIQKYPTYKAFSGTVVCNDSIDCEHRKKIEKSIMFKEENIPIQLYTKDGFEYDLSSFCGLVIKNELIQKIGLPNKDFFIWYDDTEYSLRIRKETKIFNINKARLNHKVKVNRASVTNVFSWKSYYGIRNKAIMIKKHGTSLQFRLHLVRMNLGKIKNYIFYLMKKDINYKHNYNVYRDALCDVKKDILGFNEKYRP